MEIHSPLALLGAISPAQFMRKHWHKKPLLVRQAIRDVQPPIDRQALFALAAREEVESRLIRQDAKGQWSLRHGPFARRALPPLDQPNWSLLVQGVDLHHDAAHALLQQFRFLPDARIDDLMISYASEGGGVGPHFDSYDVFLLQVQGHRRWSIGRQRDLSLKPGLPLKILADFEPEQSFVLAPGDMLYLPPLYAHDGVAQGGDCMTCSIGLRSPARAPLGADLLVRIAEAQAEALDEGDMPAGPHYRDGSEAAQTTPARMPEGLQRFAREAVMRALREPHDIDRALGESMTEPKSKVWFESGDAPQALQGVQAVRLDRRSRMLYDARHLYINGESFRASGRDATLMRRLADQRFLNTQDLRGASDDALALLGDWCEAGWLHADA